MKTGRKQKHFVTAEGEIIPGLSRRPSDGRWRVIGSQITFTEPDEARAVARFRELTGGDDARAAAQVERAQETMSGLGPGGRMWAWFAEQIRTRPQWVAEQTGIEQIGYLSDIRPPAPLPTFDELEAVWQKHAKCSGKQKTKVLNGWRDFVDTSKIAGLRDVTPEVVVEYQDAVHARGASGKQQSHIFAGIRRVLRFARDRNVARDAIGRILDHLDLLKPSESATSLDPKPIEVDDWRKLHAAAEGDDLAMILLMLNGAFYPAEAITLEWGDVTGDCIITHRAKTGKCVRVCALWPATLAALAQVRRRGDHIFYNHRGMSLGVSGASLRFKLLAEKAGVKVSPSQLRDGAYTAAVQANVTTSLCQLLVGHRSGVADHYVKRSPGMVRPATDAIYRHYFQKDV